MRILTQIGLVALGSAVGGLLRWGLTTSCARLWGTAFPWGTLLINLSRSLFLGWITTLFRERLLETGLAWLHPDDLRLMLAVGFTGAYTTFSTFEYESQELLRDQDGLRGLTYIFASVFLGLLAVRLGMYLARLR